MSRLRLAPSKSEKVACVKKNDKMMCRQWFSTFEADGPVEAN